MTYDDIINNITHSGSTQLLVKLFGGQVYKILHISANYSGPDQTLLSIFGSLMSGIALWMFVFVVLYFFMTGTVNQAQSGDFMCKNWNGFWPILRLGFGVSSVIPFPGTNLVLIQAFVIAISLMSSSVADLTWGKMLSEAGSAGITAQKNLSPSIGYAKTNAYLMGAYNYSVCAVNKIKYGLPDNKITAASFDPVNPGNDPESQEIALSCSGDKFQTFLNTVPSLPSPPDLTPAPNSDLVSNDTQAKFNAYQKKQYDYYTTMEIRSYIQRVYNFVSDNIDAINAHNTGIQNQWANIETDFNADLKKKMRSVIMSDQEMTKNVFTTQANLYGWISAGNYYRQLAQQQQIVSNAISSALQNTPGYVNLSRQSDLTASNNITDFSNQNANSWMNHAAHSMANHLGFGLLKSDETTDPILAMTSFGQKLEGTAEALMAMHGIGSILGLIPGVGALIGSTLLNNGILDFIMGITAVAGLVLGTVLPCMPWIIFMFAVLGWLIHVAEMFIASPFWVVANAIPDGNTMISDVAKKGANNILFIVLFPTLALGGLVASLAISWIGMGLVNQFTYTGFQAIVGFGTFPLAFIGILAIYVVLAWTVLMSSLNLIQEFPRTILNWISLSSPGVSPFKDKHEGINSVLMAGPLSRTAGSAVRSISNSGGVKGAISGGKNLASTARELKKP